MQNERVSRALNEKRFEPKRSWEALGYKRAKENACGFTYQSK